MQVQFRTFAPNARRVLMASELNGWDYPKKMVRQGEDWVVEVEIDPRARIEYQFIVDGGWILDPNNPIWIENGIGGKNSCYQGPDYRNSANLKFPAKPMARIELLLGGVGHERTVVVFAPEDPIPDLPMFIYGDGQDYENRLQPQTLVANMISAGEIPPLVLVLVPPVDRMTEYWRKSASYEQFIAKQVISAVRGATGASKKPEDIYVGGASLGGLISVRLAENYPDVISGGVHSQSGAFWASPGSMNRASLRKIDSKAKLFFDWGTFEGVLTESNERMADTLKLMGREFGHMITPEGHNWSAWQARYADGLRYLMAGR